MATLNLYPSDTTFVSKYKPDQNFCTNRGLRIQSDYFGNCYTSLIKFGIPPGISDLNIVRAVLYLYIENQCLTNTAVPHQIQIYKNLYDFNECSVTWDTHPAYLDTPSALLNLNGGIRLEYTTCDITPLFLDWADNLTLNYGMTLASTYTGTSGYTLLDSSRGSHPPFLLLEYCPKRPCCPCPGCEEASIQSDFSDRAFHLYDMASELFTPAINISQSQTVSVYAQNLGANTVTVRLQMSPDGSTFLDDPTILTLSDDNLAIVVPQYMAKYFRVKVASADVSAYTNVQIWYQSQQLNYTMQCQIP
ncbi:MAG: DUF6385 domain-containing protein [Lawsonibacter sp.]|nr:DUF6385 domain-containing protein [Lawsonibacter sp.]